MAEDRTEKNLQGRKPTDDDWKRLKDEGLPNDREKVRTIQAGINLACENRDTLNPPLWEEMEKILLSNSCYRWFWIFSNILKRQRQKRPKTS